MNQPLVKKVLLIGWDAADWKVIHPLLDAGKMPNLAGLINEGVMGNIATLNPQLSPMLWTSIATGKHAFKHGILGFTEPDPNTGGIRPITNLSRKTKAIWNILSQVGLKSNIIGWWPSHPAEPINGVMVSNLYQKIPRPINAFWPLKPSAVHPKRLIRNLAQLRCNPMQLDTGHIEPFVPRMAEVDQHSDRRLETLSNIIAETCSIENAALAVMGHEPWHFTAVYFDGIDHFSHIFMCYHPPKQDRISREDFEIYRHVIEGAYILHDISLGKLIRSAGQDTTVILVSDHGFHSDHLRPKSIPNEPAGPALEHRPYGIFVIKGPCIKKDELIYGASLLDICPTILSLFGLPQGMDMDGKILLNAFLAPPPVAAIQSWDAVDGNSGEHPTDIELDSSDSYEVVQQLVALGYIERPDEDQEEAAGQAQREQEFNLARSYMNANRYLEAIPILEKLVEDWPDQYRFGIHLADSYLSVSRTGDARQALDGILAKKEENALKAQKAIHEFEELHKETNLEYLHPEEEQQLIEWRREASLNPPLVNYLMGSLLHAEGNYEDALERLERAEDTDTQNPRLYLKLGQVHLDRKKAADAERCFNRALTLDPDNSTAHLGLCKCHLHRQQNSTAAEKALDAIGLRYHNHHAHFLLGIALHRLGYIDRSIEALKVSISQNPNYPKAHYRLAYIYKWRTQDLEEAAKHRLLAEIATKRIKRIEAGHIIDKTGQDRHFYSPVDLKHWNRGEETPVFSISGPAEDSFDDKGTITIVTGLPRSGTSMMMQMLEAGGIEPYTDGSRKSDIDSPRGYYESEKAKGIHVEAAWLKDVKGKAVKIIAQQLRYLPSHHSYRIVFMERNINEVIESQNQMLENQGVRTTLRPRHDLSKVFTRQVEQVKKSLSEKCIPVLYMRYDKMIHNQASAVRGINGFFHGRLDESQMISVVDPGLYRHRNTNLAIDANTKTPSTNLWGITS